MTRPSSADPVTPSRICGLLYCGDSVERHVNLAAGALDPLTIYVRNALALAWSAQAQGQELTLVTNDAERIGRLITHNGGDCAGVRLEQLSFSLDVPSDIPFRSAHFKLELMRGFGEGRFGEFPVLVDIDAVLTRCLVFPDADALWAYDLSRQEWGDTIDCDAATSLDRLAGAPLTSRRWFGGEFLAGRSRNFAALWQAIERVWPSYCTSLAQVYRPGDEMVLSTALNMLIDRGLSVRDAGQAAKVSRWWSVRTTNPIESLSAAARSALLHLPADKAFLAKFADRPFDPLVFLSVYRQHVAAQLRSNRIRSIAAHLRGRRHAPMLA